MSALKNVSNVDIHALFCIAKDLGVDLRKFKTNSDTMGFARRCAEMYRNNPNPYPDRRVLRRYHVYHNGLVLGSLVTVDQKAELVKSNPDALVQPVDADDADFTRMALSYRDYSNKVEMLFREGLIWMEHLQDNPKARALYSKAYDKGHSSGFEEIAGVFLDLADLIR